MTDTPNHEPNPTAGSDDDALDAVETDQDRQLAAAGERLRADTPALSPTGVQVAVLRRRSRRLGALAGAAVLTTAVLGAALVRSDKGSGGTSRPTAIGTANEAEPSKVEALVASLGDKPIDPRKVKLLSTVKTFGDCDGLINDLRVVGAEHVGSRGFGGIDRFQTVGYAMAGGDEWLARSDSPMANGSFSEEKSMAPQATTPAMAADGGTTLGTNVQVVGVDELDNVKAVGKLVYDLDPNGNLRITDATTLKVLGTAVLPAGASSSTSDRGSYPYPSNGATQLLVDGTNVVVFGTETEVSEPVEDDPSATQSATTYLTIAFVNAADSAAPAVTDRVRVEGSLVSARMVDGQVRLVTTSDMADLGFLVPTTPNSVPKALEQNRRSVASSTAADWIPDWQRGTDAPEPLVPCERVHVPDTFAGVAMTSMVTFPTTGTFEPTGTAILAPGDTLYAGLDKVAISSGVWVDPIDRDTIELDHWQTAIHEFSFADTTAPTYEGSGIVDGATIGQFAFGEIGDSLAVVTGNGTPWNVNPDVDVDLTVLTPDGNGKLTETSKVDDLSNGKGAVQAVRFVENRVLISTGDSGRSIYVLDVTDPAAPRRGGTVTVPGDVGYFHPLPDNKALMIGSRGDEVGEGNNTQYRTWVQAHLLDVTNADIPKVLSTWETPWAGDNVAGDHHAFTYWPDRNLAMWGTYNTQYEPNVEPPLNHAVVVSTEGNALTEVAQPEAQKPPAAAAPCTETPIPDQAKGMVGKTDVLLNCGDANQKTVEWPRYSCYRVEDGLVAEYSGGAPTSGSFFLCSPVGPPVVSRVLVVDGTPIMYTDQTMERLDPTSFVSTAVAYHPAPGGGMYLY